MYKNAKTKNLPRNFRNRDNILAMAKIRVSRLALNIFSVLKKGTLSMPNHFPERSLVGGKLDKLGVVHMIDERVSQQIIIVLLFSSEKVEGITDIG